MTAQAQQLGAASYELEGVAANWADSTDTFGTRVPVMGEPVIPQDIQSRIPVPITKQRLSEAVIGPRGPWKQSSFTVKVPLTGHGSATTGALTATAVSTLLTNFFGAGSVLQVGTTVDTPASATEFSLVGGTVEGNNLVRIGAPGDGRGGGQFAVVNSDSTITLLTALAATPNAGDVVHAAINIYPSESSSVVASTRWLLQTANGQWKARGCFPMTAALEGLGIGENPFISLTYGVSRWESDVNETFPVVAAAEQLSHVLCAQGACFMQDVGTATRQTFAMRKWSLEIDQTVVPIMGQDGADAYQTVVGAVRTGSAAKLSITIDAEASGTATLKDIYNSDTNQHVLMTLATVAGRSLGFYFPNCLVLDHPTQEAMDGLNRQTINLMPATGPDVTSDETAAAWKIGLA